MTPASAKRWQQTEVATPMDHSSSTDIPAIDEIIDNFSLLDDWDDRYRYVIELGRGMSPLPEIQRTDANKVQGCASQVWLATTVCFDNDQPLLNFQGDSDAHIVRGLVAILLAVVSGKEASEILAADQITLFDRLGLREHLTPQRSNGFRSMVARIRSDAQQALSNIPRNSGLQAVSMAAD
jgi:cysteine desulfuration protein SufE